MTTLKDRVRFDRTGMQGRDELYCPRPVSMSLEETGNVRDFTLDRNEEWALRAEIEVTFWANRAQLPEAQNTARKVMASRLYQDVLCLLPELRMAISDGDRESCFMVADRIQAVLMGDDA